MPKIKVMDGNGNVWEEDWTPEQNLHTKNVEIEAQGRVSATDWTMCSDVGLKTSCKTAFETYRAKIREIRIDGTKLPKDGWPEEPKVEFK